MQQNYNPGYNNNFVNENNNNKGCFSWPAIILALIFFWPVGLYLLIKRFSNDRSAVMNTGNGPRIIGIILIVLGIFALIGSLSDADVSVVFVAIMMIVGGGVLVSYASKMKKKGERYKAYIGMIVNGNETYIDNIASALNTPYSVVRLELQEMINKRYFAFAHINDNERRIILNQPVYQPAPQQFSQAAPINQPRVVTCPNCSATNTLYEAVGNCEYCGSPIQ